MKHKLPPPPSCSLQVYPLGGRLSAKTPIELNLAKGELIKHEPVTTIWRNVCVEDRQAVVKMYRRGLFLQYYGSITSFRTYREFDRLRVLEDIGVPCSIPLFWSRGRFGPFGWAEMLVTEAIGESQVLRDLLNSSPEAARSLDLSPLFRNLARMHAAGVHHGMLRTRNILVKDYPEASSFMVIDLARSHLFSGDIRRKRMALYDLLSLCEGLLPFYTEDEVRTWLSAYGTTESQKSALGVRLKKFQSTPFLRKTLAWEFDIRNAFSRARSPSLQPVLKTIK